MILTGKRSLSMDLELTSANENDIEEKNAVMNRKLREKFDGKIVRKDLTKHIKEGANVPVYVLEYLLGQYCNSEDEEIISSGVESVKHILADNYVRPDESEKVLSRLRQRGSMSIIDRVTVSLNLKYDEYEAEFSNLGLGGVPISEEYPEKFDRLLCGGIWCIIQLEYNADGDESNPIGFVIEESKKKKKKDAPVITISKLKPIQMPSVDIAELKEGRKAFTKDEWIDIMLRSVGMEPDRLTKREKWLLLLRLVPLVENNFNLCELGPRSTGKSHIYKEVSPNSILVSGGQTTVANLFYNMGMHTMGLVGLWDCVAFDEVAGIKFKDKDGVQIMKDYMASGSFARGKEEKSASASMVFVGNINQSVDVLLKTSSLFDPFPPEMGTDTAFLDRMHCYLPGWEIPKFRPEHFTNDYGFITDYLAEFIRELRKEQYGDAIEKYFRLGKNLNQRDTIAVRKLVDGLIKIIYPNGEFTKEELEEILQIALEMRRRVKEQLKKLGGMEFYDVNFSYIDNETFEEHYVSVPEQGGGKLIPEGMMNPGQVYTASHGKNGMIGVFRLESQMLPGNGKFDRTGLGSDRDCKEATNTAYSFLKANAGRISGSIGIGSKDFVINYQDLQGLGMTSSLALPTLIALCSIALGKPVQSSLAVLGEISISGTMIKVENLADTLQVCLDSGAKKVLLPQISAVDLGTVPPDLMSSFNLIFYQSAEDAVFKALGVE
jgi:ATP-dependent Lon protease